MTLYYPSARNNHPSLATIIRLLTAIIRLLATIIRLLAMITRLHFKISTASDNTVSPQYAYPAWCHVLGWAITLTSLAALPILAVTEIFRWMFWGKLRKKILYLSVQDEAWCGSAAEVPARLAVQDPALPVLRRQAGRVQAGALGPLPHQAARRRGGGQRRQRREQLRGQQRVRDREAAAGVVNP